MGRKKVVKDTTIQETPVIFFLRIQENTPYDVLPAGQDFEYTELPKQVTTTDYAEILQNVHNDVHQNVSMNSELLKDILDKSQHTEYPTDTCCFWCCHKFHWTSCILPISYDAYKNIYNCEGNFCSPECVNNSLITKNKIKFLSK